MKLTLDWNCVIEVEEHRRQATFVIDLVGRHRSGEFEVALLAASASENTKSKLFPGNAKLFKDRVAHLGWNDLPIVPMPAVWGLSYWDFCFYTDATFEPKFDALWTAIVPTVPRKASDHLQMGQSLDVDSLQSEALAKWRNTWCDVMSAFSHIHAARDIFVTNNTSDFQRNMPKLSPLGMQNICIPEDARRLISSLA